MWFCCLGLGDPPDKEMKTHSSLLAWEIPRTEEPGGLQSIYQCRAQLSVHIHTATHRQHFQHLIYIP